MIVIVRTPVMNLIPDNLLSELIDVKLPVVEERKNVFAVRKEDILSELKKLKRNYALYYYERAIHLLGIGPLITISRNVVRYVN